MSVQVRGSVFFAFFEGVSRLRGPATADRVRDALPARLRERVVNGGMTRVGWYPMSDYAELYAALESVVRGGDELSIALGRVTTERDTEGLLRYVLAITSPDLLLRYADKVLLSYVRGARLRCERPGPGHAVITIEDLHGASFAVHAELVGTIAFLLEKCGGRGVSVTRLPTTTPSTAIFEARWQ